MTRSVSVDSHTTAMSARHQHLPVLRADAEVVLVGHGREDNVALQRLLFGFSVDWQLQPDSPETRLRDCAEGHSQTHISKPAKQVLCRRQHRRIHKRGRLDEVPYFGQPRSGALIG